MKVVETILSHNLTPEKMTLADIKYSIPTLTDGDPLLYALYLHHNKDLLTDTEKDVLQAVILKLKAHHQRVDDINLAYMSRHLKIKEDEDSVNE